MGCGSSTAATDNTTAPKQDALSTAQKVVNDINESAPSGVKKALHDVAQNGQANAAAAQTTATDGAAAGAAVVAAAGGMAVAGLSNMVDYAAKAQEVMEKLEALNLGSTEGAAMLKESFVALQDVITLVAHVAVPPPGGQIIAAAIVITAMVIKGAMNVQACRELAIRCNRLVKVAYPSREVLERGPANLKSALEDFRDVCDSIMRFVQEVIDQGWFKKMLTWKATSDEIKSFDIELKSVYDALSLAVNVATLGGVQQVQDKMREDNAAMMAALQDIESKGKEVEAMVAEYPGGAEKMCEDEGALKKLIAKAGGADAVQLTMQKKGLDELAEIKGLIKSQAADNVDGPHLIIKHESLKTLWKDKLGKSEVVSWDKFHHVFPSEISGVDPEEIQLLDKELASPEDKLKLQFACDLDDDDAISVTEITQAFPRTSSILARVRDLKKIADENKRKGIHYGLPPLPPRIFGRDQVVDEIYSLIGLEGKTRMVKIVGGPGEGKVTVACDVLSRLYDRGQAVGGVWRCNMSDVKTCKEMLNRFVVGLTHVPKASDKEAGEESSFKARLTEMKIKNAPLYVLIDDCEDVAINVTEKADGEAAALPEYFDSKLVQMVDQVPNLRLIVLSREDFACEDLKNFLAGAIHKVQLEPLPLDQGVQMIMVHCPRIVIGDAKKIAENYNSNPLMLNIVVDALKEGRMTLEQAVSGANLSNVAEEDRMLEKALNKVERSVMRSLDTLKKDDCKVLLRMAIVLPGVFDKNVINQVLGLPAPKAQTLLNKFKKCTLLEGVGDEFRVTPMLRQTANKIYTKGEERADEMGCGRDAMQPVWKKFLAYCLKLVTDDFKRYKSAPMNAYNSILRNKPNVHQALRLATEDPQMTEGSLQQLLDMVVLLPYLGLVHDPTTVQEACDSLFSMVNDDADMNEKAKATAQGQCRAVQAHFAASGKSEQQQALLELTDEVKVLLGESSDAKAQLVLAMALRRKGVLQRDLGEYKDSIQSLQDATYAAESCALGTDHARLELILDQAELAGTLDYVGDMVHGDAVAEGALQKARDFYGPDAAHPVTALCLTTYGYFLKGKGNACDQTTAAAEEKAAAAGKEGKTEDECMFKAEAEAARDSKRKLHEKALEVHNEALEMRRKVLGKEHLEVALSLQQAAISLAPLGQFEKAEEYLKKSLDIRINSLKRDHFLVANTYRQLSDLYLEWAKHAAFAAKVEDAERSLTRLVSVGRTCWKGNKKLTKAATDLAALLKQQGKPEEAQKVAVEFDLQL